MAPRSEVHDADPIKVREFLRKVLPFSELESEKLQDLTTKFRLDFFTKGTLIFQQDYTEVDYLHFIYSGGVKIYLTNSEGVVTLKDFRGEGSYFGALAIIRESLSIFNVETIEDTFCFLLARWDFMDLVNTDPQFAGFFLKTFSEDVVNTAYAELRSRKIKSKPQAAFYLFGLEVTDVIKRSPEWIPGSATIQQAASRMDALQIGSLLIEDPSGEIAGIVTDKDLRTKVVAKGLDFGTEVSLIMSSPVHRVPADAVCFDALLQMMNHQVHHLIVERGNHVMGVITAHDIMVHQGTSPLYLFREITAQRKIENLYSLSQKIPMVVRTLIEEGAKANNITRMITVLNDHILIRLLTLLLEEVGPPPYPFCWLTLGSEGRKEQTFKTDQDNALVYETPPDEWEQIKRAKLYFRRLGNKAIKHLESCGYPLCQGDMMASNPKWRKPFKVWQTYFDRWLNAPDPEEVLHATIFFDFRPLFGDISLGDDLRDYLAAHAPTKGIFLMHLAKDCLAGRPPLSFFRNFIVEKDGEHKNRLDLKTRGLVPLIDFARVFALKYGIKDTNTLERLQSLGDSARVSEELFSEAAEAYEFQMQMRLVNQLRMIESGRPPHNFIDPAELSELEKQALKESFAVIGRVQTYIKDQFKVVE